MAFKHPIRVSTEVLAHIRERGAQTGLSQYAAAEDLIRRGMSRLAAIAKLSKKEKAERAVKQAQL